MAEAAAVPIHKGQDFYVPYFQVKLNGRPQGQDVIRDITQVSYKDNIKEIDSFEITINNWDAETRAFKYSDDTLFDPGTTLELWMGYYGQDKLRLMVTGEITALRPSFPAGGGSTLAISGLNLLHRLRTDQRSVTWENVTDSQIAEQIANDHGFEPKTNPFNEEKHVYLLQDSQYDIIFLMERARRNGYVLCVKENGENGQSSKPVLFFGRSQDVVRPVYELHYGRSLIDFKPDLTTANQVAEVTVRGWDRLNKKKIEYTAKRGEIAVQGLGEAGGQKRVEQSFKQRREVIVTKPVETEAEAQKLAVSTLEENAKDMVRATGSTVGLPDLRAGSKVTISGVGKRFNGPYFVVATTHAIGDSGYTTQFECRREEKV